MTMTEELSCCVSGGRFEVLTLCLHVFRRTIYFELCSGMSGWVLDPPTPDLDETPAVLTRATQI